MKGKRLNWENCYLLITKFDFGQRCKLWNAVSMFKYIPSPQFGIHTGMCCNHSEEIWMNLVFSAQPDKHPDNMSLVTYR
jgi:hypothetical protein